MIEANPNNPNEMTDAQFNMLYDNIEKMGVTDPLLCVAHPDKDCDIEAGTGWLRIVGGEHRWEVAKLVGLKEIPVTIVVSEDFDDEAQKFQLVRHNIIHGQMSPQKFVKLYESLSETYTNEVAADMFGFAEEEDFIKLVASTAKSLPKEMQEEFSEASKELKTIDDLTNLLNRMFNQYGDTLDYGYMILDYGGKESVWIRMSNPDKVIIKKIMKRCVSESKTVDSFMSALLIKVLQTSDLYDAVMDESTVLDKVAEDGSSSLEELDKIASMNDLVD